MLSGACLKRDIPKNIFSLINIFATIAIDENSTTTYYTASLECSVEKGRSLWTKKQQQKINLFYIAE